MNYNAIPTDDFKDSFKRLAKKYHSFQTDVNALVAQLWWMLRIQMCIW